MKLILLVIAICLCIFAAFSFSPWAGVNLGWLGVAFFAGSFAVRE